MLCGFSWIEPVTGKPWRLGVFMNYVPPMIRQNENFALSMDPEGEHHGSLSLSLSLSLSH